MNYVKSQQPHKHQQPQEPESEPAPEKKEPEKKHEPEKEPEHAASLSGIEWQKIRKSKTPIFWR
jgi:hypothetical protein